jgi:hypothetical protein
MVALVQMFLRTAIRHTVSSKIENWYLKRRGSVMSVSVAQSFESLVSYMMSLKRLESLSPSLLYPGHGPVVSDACDRIRQYLHHREQRERQVLAQLSSSREPCSVARLVANLYPDLHPDLVPGAKGNISSHLQKLEEEMRIKRHTVAGESRWTLTLSAPPKL